MFLWIRYKFSHFFSSRALAIYQDIMVCARNPVLYQRFLIPDDVDQRFTMVIIHTHLVFRHLSRVSREGRYLSQRIFDVMFGDFDKNFREIGISDSGISREIKKTVQVFYARISLVEVALNKSDKKQQIQYMSECLKDLLYKGPIAQDVDLEVFADYFLSVNEYVQNHKDQPLLFSFKNFSKDCL